MKVIIVGAGFSGIATARVLRELGHTVVIYEKDAYIGGVWSPSRQYPGVKTQNTKDTYHLSDMPMPSSYPEWPSGSQVQAYLERYVEVNGLSNVIQLRTEVTKITRPEDTSDNRDVTPKGWIVETSNGKKNSADHVVVCNGVFCEGEIPTYPGLAEFKASGGHVLHTNEVGKHWDVISGRKVLVVGYGKSACDVANAIAGEEGGAEQTTVVARNLIWKLPTFILGLCYKWLLLTRFGEALFKYIHLSSPVERFFHNTGIGLAVRNSIVKSLGWVVKKQLGLEPLGLLPEEPFETIARSTISLSTEGFYDKIKQGEIVVHRDKEIVRLAKSDRGQLGAILTDGVFIEADIVICGTGFRQDPPSFLPLDVRKTLTDDHGFWLLYQHVKPLYIDDLTFNGYNSSLFCSTSAEAAALWIGSYLARGNAMLPLLTEQVDLTERKLKWLDRRSQGKHARGTNLVPFSLHSIDELLAEAGVNISRFQRLKQWLFPVDPSAYQGLIDQLVVKLPHADAAGR